MQILFIICVLLSTLCSGLWVYAFIFNNRSFQGIPHTYFMLASVFFAGCAHVANLAL